MNYRRTPHEIPLSPGSLVWRVHRSYRLCTAFKEEGAHRYFGGGRFDSTDDDVYPYMYAARSAEAALSELLLRDEPTDDVGDRQLPVAALSNRCISAIATTRSLRLLSLSTPQDLAAVGQDQWLIHAEGREYAQTRHWVHWLRANADWAQGVVWPSKRYGTDQAVLLFGDRRVADALDPTPVHQITLDTADGIQWVNKVLVPLYARVEEPAE
jgi:RES domain-containing protein